MAGNYENLLNAMKMEEEYRKLQADHKTKTEFGYHEKLKSFGFSDTIVYERAKDEYYLKSCNLTILEIGASEFITKLTQAVTNQIETLFIVTPEKLIAWVGTDGYNKQYCSKNKIPIYEVKYNGGTIVTGIEDVAIGLLIKKDRPRFTFSDVLYEIIKESFPNAEFRGNDVLINGYKVFGIGIKEINGMYLATYQFTFKAYPEQINKICLKPTDKPIKGMSELGDFTKTELINKVKIWLQGH